MVEFDLELLDKRSYGLGRSYDLCPNYSDAAEIWKAEVGSAKREAEGGWRCSGIRRPKTERGPKPEI